MSARSLKVDGYCLVCGLSLCVVMKFASERVVIYSPRCRDSPAGALLLLSAAVRRGRSVKTINPGPYVHISRVWKQEFEQCRKKQRIKGLNRELNK